MTHVLDHAINILFGKHCENRNTILDTLLDKRINCVIGGNPMRAYAARRLTRSAMVRDETLDTGSLQQKYKNGYGAMAGFNVV
jgi:hypothetical protein